MTFRILIHFSNGVDNVDLRLFDAEGPAEEAAVKFFDEFEGMDPTVETVTVLRPIATFRPKRIIERVPFTINGGGSDT